MTTNWNKVAALAATIAIPIAIVGAVPVAQGWVRDWNAPKASITSISDYQSVGDAIDARGQFSHIDGSNSLFLIQLSGIEGRFYPVTRIDTHSGSGTFNTSGKAIRLGVGPQELQLYLIPTRDQESLASYIQKRTGAGLGNLPSEALWLSTTHVTVTGSETAAPSSTLSNPPPSSGNVTASIDQPKKNSTVPLRGVTVSGRITEPSGSGASLWLLTLSDNQWYLDQLVDVKADGSFRLSTGQIGDSNERGKLFTLTIIESKGASTVKIKSAIAAAKGGDVEFAQAPGVVLRSVTVRRS